MPVFIALLFFILSVGVFANLQRRKRHLSYGLTPNCLLTRWPILFLSGPRSLFYFSHYWNVFPEFLTEHGYEVYSLNLPWAGPVRVEKLREVLRTHAQKGRRYHVIVDAFTRQEMQELWDLQLPCVVSITEVSDAMSTTSRLGIWQTLSYQLHRLKMWPRRVPSPHTLGVSAEASLKNAQLLLHRVSQLAEQDVQATEN